MVLVAPSEGEGLAFSIMKLAIAQMVFGVIIVSDFACLLLLGVGWIIWYFHYYQVYIVLGSLVLGCGIAQFAKARVARIKYEATP